MGVKIRGLDALTSVLSRIGETTSDKERKLVDSFAEKIVARAKQYAPVDEGNLEKSIVAERTRTGINGRIISKIGVDVSKLGPGWAVRGYRYHVRMHEDPTVSGKGDKSRDKARDLGVMVGYKYMARALEDFRQPMMEAAKKLAREVGR